MISSQLRDQVVMEVQKHLDMTKPAHNGKFRGGKLEIIMRFIAHVKSDGKVSVIDGGQVEVKNDYQYNV